MCTAVSWKASDCYFGRNLDFEYSYEEQVVITPRKYEFVFRNGEKTGTHYAMIGTAYVVDNYPLYYDAVNEAGLGMAGLYFAGNAMYYPMEKGKDNIAPFELIPWILGQCKDVREATDLLKRINLWKEPFNEKLSLTPLHWFISDGYHSIVLESTGEGIQIYNNPVGVLTNNPTFPIQMKNLEKYENISPMEPEETVKEENKVSYHTRGKGTLGLPGDLTSMGRFVRASIVRNHALSGETETENVTRFFHILGSVEQQLGCVILEKEQYERTIYSSCCNASKGIYYYKTYDNQRILGVDMKKENIDGKKIIAYPFITDRQIEMIY